MNLTRHTCNNRQKERTIKKKKKQQQKTPGMVQKLPRLVTGGLKQLGRKYDWRF
jgi:hypothetical protein